MDEDLLQELKELDAEGKLEKYKTVVANAANFSFSTNSNSGDIPKSLTTGIVGNTSGEYTVHNVPAIYPATSPIPNFQWTIADNTMTVPAPPSGQELLGMLVEGKDLIKDKDEFLEIIMRLPSVNGDNLKAIEVYERLRKLAIASGLVDVETTGVKKEEK